MSNTPTTHVLVLEDDLDTLTRVVKAIKSANGDTITVYACQCLEEVEQLLAEPGFQLSLALLDFKVRREKNGQEALSIDLAARLRRVMIQCSIVFFTAYPDDQALIAFVERCKAEARPEPPPVVTSKSAASYIDELNRHIRLRRTSEANREVEELLGASAVATVQSGGGDYHTGSLGSGMSLGSVMRRLEELWWLISDPYRHWVKQYFEVTELSPNEVQLRIKWEDNE